MAAPPLVWKSLGSNMLLGETATTSLRRTLFGRKGVRGVRHLTE